MTARSRRNGGFGNEADSSILRWQHPLILRTPNGTGAKASSKSANGSRANRHWERGKSACGSKESDLPFPVSPPGKVGAGGFPPRRKKRGSPHKRAPPPCESPARFSARGVDRSRPSHGSRDRRERKLGLFDAREGRGDSGAIGRVTQRNAERLSNRGAINAPIPSATGDRRAVRRDGHTEQRRAELGDLA